MPNISDYFSYVELVGGGGLAKQISGVGLFKLLRKLKEVKTLAKEWSIEKGNSTKLIARSELESSIQELEGDPYSTVLQTATLGKIVKLKEAIRKEEA